MLPLRVAYAIKIDVICQYRTVQRALNLNCVRTTYRRIHAVDCAPFFLPLWSPLFFDARHNLCVEWICVIRSLRYPSRFFLLHSTNWIDVFLIEFTCSDYLLRFVFEHAIKELFAIAAKLERSKGAPVASNGQSRVTGFSKHLNQSDGYLRVELLKDTNYYCTSPCALFFLDILFCILTFKLLISRVIAAFRIQIEIGYL